jgi:HEAT repeat protein/uncharacterized protein YwqG
MMVSLAQYAEQKRDEAGESVIPSGIRKRWRERIVANGWQEMGEEGAAKYLDGYGQNVGAPKVIQFARQAEAEGCPEMAQGFWRKAYELELGHPPPADGVNDEPSPIPVPSKLTESDIRKMEARKDIEGLTNALYYKSPDRDPTTREEYLASRVRGTAANALIRVDRVQATKALMEALKGDDANVRASAAGGPLGQIGGSQAVDLLIEALKDDHPEVRRNAALALGKTGDRRAAGELLLALKDSDSLVRSYAAGAFRQIVGVQAAKKALDEDEGKSAIAASWVQYAEQKRDEAGESAIPSDIRKRWQERIVANDWHEMGEAGAAKYLTEYGRNTGVPELIHLARQAEAEGHLEVARGFWREAHKLEYGQAPPSEADTKPAGSEPSKSKVKEMEAKRDVPGLIQALGWKSVRMEAMGALGRLGDERATVHLINILRDENNLTRSAAVRALGRLGDPRAIDALVGVLRKKKMNESHEAALSLGQIGDERAVDPLTQALQEDGWNDASRVRQSAVTALGEIGGDRAGAALVDVLKNGTKFERLAAAKALGQIGDPRAVDALSDALQKDADRYVRAPIAEVLGQIGDPRAAAALAQAVKDDADSDVRRCATEALQLLEGDRAEEAVAQLLQDDDEHARERAARKLGRLGGPQAEKALALALNDEAEGVRQAVTRALAQLGGAQALAALLEALRDDARQVRIPTVAALGKIGNDRAVPALIEVLKDDSGPARAAAAQALGQIRDGQAVPALIETLQDEAEEVRAAAVQALGRIGDERAVDALVEVLAEADCAKAATWALEQIGGVRAAKALQASAGPSKLRLYLEKLPAELVESFQAEFGPFQGNIEATIQPYIEVCAQPEDRMLLWHSKFGGRPYLPQGTAYPTTPDGRHLFLLAQINFAQVPRLEPFPREGILQFYIADDGQHGMNYDDLTTQEGFRVLYFPQVVEDEKELVTGLSFLPKHVDSPFSKPRSLTFARRYAPISAGDYRFESAVFGKDISRPEEKLQVYERIISSYGDKIGGYPYFVTWRDRYDPRKKKARKEEDLRKRDFSRVMYYCDWDID